MEIEIKHIAFGGEEHKKEIELRYRVLRQPLGLNYTQEQLDTEKDESHFAAFEGEKLVGCLLMKSIDNKEIKMRQVAVDGGYQGRALVKRLFFIRKSLLQKIVFRLSHFTQEKRLFRFMKN